MYGKKETSGEVFVTIHPITVEPIIYVRPRGSGTEMYVFTIPKTWIGDPVGVGQAIGSYGYTSSRLIVG
jgi:hypothetical protein